MQAKIKIANTHLKLKLPLKIYDLTKQKQQAYSMLVAFYA